MDVITNYVVPITNIDRHTSDPQVGMLYQLLMGHYGGSLIGGKEERIINCAAWVEVGEPTERSDERKASKKMAKKKTKQRRKKRGY